MSDLKLFLDDALNNHRSRHFVKTQIIISVVTITSITGIVLETVHQLSQLHPIFLFIELATTAAFTLEYISRIFVSKRKLGYILSGWGIIDLLTILPTFLGLGNFSFIKSIRIFSLLRLLRILRIAKITRAYLQTHEDKTQEEFEKINMAIYFLALFTAIISFGAVLYELENDQLPYSNIPLAMLQSAKIILGGLGQVEPKGYVGEVTVVLARLVGLALFGLLISVIGGTLNRLLFEHKTEK